MCYVVLSGFTVPKFGISERIKAFQENELLNAESNSSFQNYYEGIHLCRVGYEKVTQTEINKIKLLLQL